VTENICSLLLKTALVSGGSATVAQLARSPKAVHETVDTFGYGTISADLPPDFRVHLAEITALMQS